jgi:hypothetical protein
MTTARFEAAIAAILTLIALVTGAPGTGRADDTPVLTDIGPALIWVGLKNSDDVGTRIDMLVQAFDADENLVGFGEVLGVWAGSSGFNNARLVTIPLLRVVPEAGPEPGVPTHVQVDARIACFVSGHRFASVLLWYNGLPIDAGRHADAGSRISYQLNDDTVTVFLTTPDVLSSEPGARRQRVELALAAPRPGHLCDYEPFGTWSVPGE